MSGSDPSFVGVKVKALILDPTTETPVMILEVQDSHNLLPVWIGPSEAQAIAAALEGIEAPRPMTHDLLAITIQTLGHRVTLVRIDTLEDGVFKAKIHLESVDRQRRSTVVIDARPSDAIALATRTQAEIEVANTVLERAQVQNQSVDEAIKTLLENLDPADLGQYEM